MVCEAENNADTENQKVKKDLPLAPVPKTMEWFKVVKLWFSYNSAYNSVIPL